MNEKNKIIEVKNLKTYYYLFDHVAKAVDDVSFEIYEGETLGVVGESGCGKSQTAFSIMRLIDKPGYIVSGSIYYRGTDLLGLTEDEMLTIRGKEISMIFQEPMNSLNPLYTIGDQIREMILNHLPMTFEQAEERAINYLDLVGIPNPEKRFNDYPHQLSGGMRQRVMIAMALACEPSLLIADEPTTALDVTIQAQILKLIDELKRKVNSAIMFITHDLGVIANFADRVQVMYAGKIVESGIKRDIFKNPLHPYTKGLLNSIPPIGFTKQKGKLYQIEGVVPSPKNFPDGCRFNTRCLYVKDICKEKCPELKEVEKNHLVACWLF
jgi:oligopeptide/dipeptide ABC transporter ATP-binding protein